MLGRSFARRRVLVSLLLAGACIGLAVVPAVTASTDRSDAKAAGPLKVAILFSGQLAGNTYSQVNYNGARKAAAAIGGGKVQIRAVYNVPYDTRATQTTLQLFKDGEDMVVDTGGYGSLFARACKQVPDKKCLDYGTQFTPESLRAAPNLTTFYVDQAPLFYVFGVAAGKLTKTGKLGFVSAFRVPFNTAVVNALALGCQSVRPDCKVLNIYLNSYYNPPKAVESTRTMLNSGADVIATFLDDITSVKIAQSKNGWGFGFYADHSSDAPKAWVTAMSFEPALKTIYEGQFRAALNGTWKANIIDYGPKSPPNIGLTKWGPRVPLAARQAATAAYKKIAAGSNPFVGPIVDAKGKVRVPKGGKLDLRGVEIYTKWTWPVKGVTGL